MSARRQLSSALLLAWLLGGCAIALAPWRAPVSEDARRALSTLIDRWHEFSDLRTVADITIKKGTERQRLTGVLLAKAPGSVRFEALSPFGQPFLFATIHDSVLTTYDATRNEAYVGPATAETTARLLSLPFDPDTLVGVLAGRAVPPRDLRVAEILPPDEHGPSLNLIGAVHQQRVWMDFDSGVVRQIQITGGRADAVVTFLRDGSGTLTGFDLVTSGSYLTGTVRYRDLVLGAGIDPERFALALPKGAKIQEIR